MAAGDQVESEKPTEAPTRWRQPWLLVLVALLGGALVPLAGEAGAQPSNCTVRINGSSATISWTADRGADSHVVSRSIDGGPIWWRGRVTGTSFTDTWRDGASYVVQARSADGVRGPMVPCAASTTPPPLGCAAPIDDDAAVQPAAQSRALLERVAFRRSLDWGPVWWHQRITRSARALDALAQRQAVQPWTSNPGCPQPGADGGADRGPKLDAVAFGDMVSCGVPGPERVAALVDTLPGFILGLGDFSQEEGTIEQFENCFDPVMGRHTPRIEPVPGNHEYRTPGAAGYFEYFGDAAGDPTKGYYEDTKGNWQILYLNSVCWEVGGCQMEAPQQQWLRDMLAAAPAGRCRIAIMHHPRWSSWGPYASRAGLDPIYSLLHEAGTDLILTGHAHHYERLIPLAANGRPDPERGFRQITVGTGGTAPRFPEPEDVLTGLGEVLITGEWGVLDLDLYDDSFDWRFVSVDNEVLDSGSDTCIG